MLGDLLVRAFCPSNRNRRRHFILLCFLVFCEKRINSFYWLAKMVRDVTGISSSSSPVASLGRSTYGSALYVIGNPSCFLRGGRDEREAVISSSFSFFPLTCSSLVHAKAPTSTCTTFLGLLFSTNLRIGGGRGAARSGADSLGLRH